MAKMGDMRAGPTREKPRKRSVVILTPMRHGGGYDGATADALVALADRGGLKAAGVEGLFRTYGGTLGSARGELVGMWMHKTHATDAVFLDADNAFDLETWDALLAVEGDVVCVPYIRRVDAPFWTIRLNRAVLDAPQVRTSSGERLLEVPGAGTGLMRISRECMRKVWGAHPDLRVWSSGYSLPFWNVFRDETSSDPIMEEDGTEKPAPEPYLVHDDFGFCAKARAAGCRVEVLVDRTCAHAGLKPSNTLAEAIFPSRQVPDDPRPVLRRT